ncbi:MAG: class I SAM-dependent methyltransferase, partial [Elusimicrobia bacterium]|nr:class I SAM-dependent methyltransferase [Elusimicrobiota bacterium]
TTRHREIEEGALRCGSCSKVFPILEGIPRFVPSFRREIRDSARSGAVPNFQKVHGSTQERFGYEWLRYPGSLPEDETIFLNETQIEREQWKGKIVLDAGCGMGRYSRVAHSLGATVVAFDLSEALLRLKDLSEESERLHLIQGNLLSLPLKEKCFDIIYSLGVIHHTPSAKDCVSSLTRSLKPGGSLSVWVYGAGGSYKNFKTNPLREDRKGLKKILPLVWMIVTVREMLSNTLRLFTVHLPHSLLYALCYPLAWLGKIPFLKYLTFSVHPLWRVRLQENFDWLTPPYQSHHTKEDLVQWYQANGLEVLKVLPHGFVPKPGLLGKKH